MQHVQYFQWREGDLFVSSEAIHYENWDTTREKLDQILALISYYETREATTTIELAMWKARIEETGARTVDERNGCRRGVPGPVRDGILQYFEGYHDEEDHASYYSYDPGETSGDY